MMTQKKRKQRRRLTPFTKLIVVALFIASGFLLYSVGKEVMTTMALQKELAEVQDKLQELQDENNFLNNEKAKLQDPDYIENYARGNYMLSKKGEQIFYLPGESDEQE